MSLDSRLRLVVADDHPIWRDAVERDLAAAGLTVVGVAGDGDKAVRVVTATTPDVLVCDLQMPGLSGVEVTRAVVPPGVRVLVLSASGEQADVLEAVKAGASGYLLKSAEAAELVDAVRRTAAGEAVFTPGLAGLVLGEYRRTADDDDAPKLTPRETEVLRLLAAGESNREIGERLFISPTTVARHVANIFGKLGVDSRVQAVVFALRHGVVDVRDEVEGERRS